MPSIDAPNPFEPPVSFGQLPAGRGWVARPRWRSIRPARTSGCLSVAVPKAARIRNYRRFCISTRPGNCWPVSEPVCSCFRTASRSIPTEICGSPTRTAKMARVRWYQIQPGRKDFADPGQGGDARGRTGLFQPADRSGDRWKRRYLRVRRARRRFQCAGGQVFEIRQIPTAWGKKGSAAGEFDVPHAIAVDLHERVYVADR